MTQVYQSARVSHQVFPFKDPSYFLLNNEVRDEFHYSNNSRYEITDIDLVVEVMVGWEGVTDPDGNAIKFSQKALSRFLEVPMLANSVSEAFFKSVAGKKRKN